MADFRSYPKKLAPQSPFEPIKHEAPYQPQSPDSPYQPQSSPQQQAQQAPYQQQALQDLNLASETKPQSSSQYPPPQVLYQPGEPSQYTPPEQSLAYQYIGANKPKKKRKWILIAILLVVLTCALTCAIILPFMIYDFATDPKYGYVIGNLYPALLTFGSNVGF